MSKEDVPDQSQYLSPKEMRDWLLQEIQDSAKAHELRVREATDFVTAYSLGEISPEEAAERNWRYQHRWQEALPGASAGLGLTDAQILEKIDKTRKPYNSLRETREGFEKRFGGRSERPPESSR